MKKKNTNNIVVPITVDAAELDNAIEKANRLVEILREAQQIIGSLNLTNSIKSFEDIPIDEKGMPVFKNQLG